VEISATSSALKLSAVVPDTESVSWVNRHVAVIGVVAVALTCASSGAMGGSIKPKSVLSADRAPTFLPDGQTIIFGRRDNYSNQMTDLHGSVRPYATGIFVWSPGGRHRANYETPDPTGHPYDHVLVITDPSGGNRHDLGAGYEPTWSRDASRLVYLRDDAIYVADGDGANAHQINFDLHANVSCGPTCSATYDRPIVSPSGRSVAFLATFVGDSPEPPRNLPASLFVVATGGGTAAQLSDEDICPPDSDVQWAPDDKWLAYIANPCDEIYGYDLAVVDAAGANGLYVKAVGGYSWSPRRNVLAYTTGKGASFATPTRKLRTLSGYSTYANPTWSPRGDRIAVARRGGVYVAPLTGLPTRIASGSAPSWSPTDNTIAYAVSSCGARQGIHLVRPDGRGDRRLTAICEIDAAGAAPIRGTAFADEIWAIDRTTQRISCGTGNDIVHANVRDVVAADCEQVLTR
jgi:Tol biopolymer transport system component